MTADASQATLGGLSPAEQQQVTEILDRYLQQIEQGETPDAEALVTAHPQWSGVLRRYLDSLGILHQAAQGMHGSEPAPLPAAITQHRRLGDYEIRRQIGRGGMGIVYEARQVSLDRRVALKALPLAAVLDKKQIARFRREAQAAAQLHHPHIVPVFGVGSEEGVHFYSMQLVEGQSIDRVLDSLYEAASDETLDMSAMPASSPANATATLHRDSTIHESVDPDVSTSATISSISEGSSQLDRRYIDRVAELGIQAASALQHAHDYGVIHRDVKPSNLMLDREGKLWITDFGLAHIQSEADMTATGDIVGTLRYMSPEQAGGGQVIDQRTDVYSLGITLHEMLTLQQAFPATDRQKLLRDIEVTEPKRVRKLNPAIPVDFETIVLKATCKDRDGRYATAQELADDLQRYLDGKPTLARRPTMLDLGTKWALRHRSLVSCFILMLTLALAGTTFSLVQIKKQKDIAEVERRDAQNQRQVAESHFEVAREIVDRFTDMSQRLTGQPRLQREMQLLGRDYYEDFIVAASDDHTLVSDLASTHVRIGAVSEQLGDLDGAIENYREAIDSFRKLALEDPAHTLDEVLSWNNLGRAFSRAGRSQDAESAYQEAATILSSYQAKSEVTSLRQDELTALVAGNLGHVFAERKNIEDAETQLLRSVAIRTRLLRSQPEDTENRIRLASNYHNLCDLLVTSDPQRAQRHSEQAIALQRQVVEERPDDVGPRADLALSFNNLGSIFLHQRNYAAAEQQYQQAIDLGRKLIGEAPELPQLRHDLAISWNNLGQTRSLVRDFQGAARAYQAAETEFRAVLANNPQDAWTKARLGGTLFNQAVASTQMRGADLHAAAKLFAAAVAIQREAVAAAPHSQQYTRLLQLALQEYAAVLAQTGQDQTLASVQHELSTLQQPEVRREL